MSGRNFPADIRSQKFLEEAINKERDARIAWFFKDSQEGDPGVKPKPVPDYPAAALIKKLREDIQKKEKGTLKDIGMRPVTPDVKEKLYDGFTKEGKGRCQYLALRKDKSPEDKFAYPLLSSWKYGWRLGEVIKKEDIRKPVNGRTGIVANTFYTRNGISTLKS